MITTLLCSVAYNYAALGSGAACIQANALDIDL